MCSTCMFICIQLEDINVQFMPLLAGCKWLLYCICVVFAAMISVIVQYGLFLYCFTEMNTRTVELHHLHQLVTNRARHSTTPKMKKECHPDSLEGMPMFKMCECILQYIQYILYLNIIQKLGTLSKFFFFPVQLHYNLIIRL